MPHFSTRRAAGALLGCLVALAVAAGPASAAVQKGFWGPVEVNGQSQFPIYQDLGVQIFQENMDWSQIAPDRPANPTDPADPAYHWDPGIDTAIADAQQAGMSVSLMVIFSPPWANGGHDPRYAPNPEDYAAFMTAAAKRYPSVHSWQIWGEPSRAHNFQPFVKQHIGAMKLTPAQAQAPRNYAQILDAAYGALKAVSPENIVVGGMSYTTGDINSWNWVRYMRLPNGKPPRMDMYGHNPFSYRQPALGLAPSPSGYVDFSDLPRFAKWIDRWLGKPPNQRHMGLFLSEWTIPTDQPDRDFNYHVTRPTQARWIRSAFAITKKFKRIKVLGWIHLYDDPPSSDGSLVNHGGLITSDGVKKPGYFAFKAG